MGRLSASSNAWPEDDSGECQPQLQINAGAPQSGWLKGHSNSVEILLRISAKYIDGDADLHRARIRNAF